MDKFTEEEITAMKKIIKTDKKSPEINPTTSDREQIIHGFHQMIRFAHLTIEGKSEFRAAQFGLNLGRTQELLGSLGGLKCWWRTYEPLIVFWQYKEIIEITKKYLAMLDLPEPTEEFINKV